MSDDGREQVADPPTSVARDAVERLAYSPTEAAAALGVSRPTIYALIERRELRRFKVGRLTKIPAADVRRLVGADDDA